MINKKIIKLLNEQVNKEFYSAYLYLDFANYYEENGLNGFANWYKIQAQEERDHAMLMMDYIHSNGEKVELKMIKEPEIELKNKEDALKEGLKHEEYVTSLINNIYAEAEEKKDYRTMQFLDWFVKEQCEEEANAAGLMEKMELFGKDSVSLYMLDAELSKRQYKAPSLSL